MRRAGVAWLCGLLLGAACAGSVDERDPSQGSGGSGAGAGSSASSGSGATAAPGSGTAGTSGAQNGGTVPCESDAVGTRTLYRLTPRQYDNTIAALAGITGTWGAGFPADSVVDGFANDAASLVVSPLLSDKLRDAAEDIAARIELSRLAPCASASADASCTDEVIRSFGERAFRRPLTDADVSRYAALAQTAGGFEAGARLIVTAMLQSPHFLYRRELGQLGQARLYALDDFEIASELSYELWQSMPDDALFQAARAGELHTKEQIEAQVTRMLQAPAARATVRAFVLEWLGLDAIATVPKDPERFPELDAALRASMLQEVEDFVDHAMFEGDGSLRALLTSSTSYVDDALAAHYGVDAAASPADDRGLHPIDLADQERAGILTLAGTMMRHARSNDSSPVHRGKLVRERLLCQVPPPPPPGIVVQPPPMDPQKTVRERYSAHAERQPCAGCHVLMDPIGFGFERFDGIGRYRQTENGQAIDVHGEIMSSVATDGTFEGTRELASTLAGSEEVRACYASKWLRFTYGLAETPTSRCVTRPLVEALAQGDVTFEALVRASTSGAQLRLRRSLNDDSGATDAPANAGSGGSGGGAGVGGSAGVPANEPDAGAVPPVAGSGPLDLPDALLLELVVNNDYGSGYCHTYKVTNQGDTPLTWRVPIAIDGTLMQNWESMASGSTGTVTFTGASHNATLEPGTSAQFGFCVTR